MGKVVNLAQGLLAFLPDLWEFSAESDDGLVVYSVNMKTTTCTAGLELLNNKSIPPKEFISEYRYSLMLGLIDLGVHIQKVDPKHPDELIATKEGLDGTVFHTFLPTSPVAHISAIYRSESDLIDLRRIRDSIIVNESEFTSSTGELVEIKVSEQWDRSTKSV